ncbi:MAG TPA: hypothetical protein VFO85_03760, partial [Vicinamibacteria bacterium]|nr:hypothetical protein [Vicinamibacteria bacterium]
MIDRGRRGPWLAVLLAACALGLANGAAAQEECAACHEDVVKSFAKSAHGVHAARGKDVSCSSCHGPGDAHIQSGGEGGIITPAKGKGEAANVTCLSCHQGGGKQAHWPGSPHQLAGVKCASCHDVHAPRTQAPAPGARLDSVGASSRKCLDCHGALRASLHQRSSHPIKDGR